MRPPNKRTRKKNAARRANVTKKEGSEEGRVGDRHPIIEPNNAIPHSFGLPRPQSLETLAEAEERANEDIFAICKALGVERTLDDCSTGPQKWGRLFAILEGIRKSGLDGITLKKILHARMITRVVRYVVDFRCFAVRFDAVPVCGQVLWNVPHWFSAMHALDQLIDLIHNSSLPRRSKALAEYRRLGKELIRAYADISLFWWEEGEQPGDLNFMGGRVKCLKTLWVLVPHKRCETPPRLCAVASSDIVHDVIPLLARLRQSIRMTPDDVCSRIFTTLSASTLLECIEAISILRPQWNLEDLTGLSYSELVRQCLACEGYKEFDVGNRMLQMDLIGTMTACDHSLGLQEAIVSSNFVTWAASFMRLVISQPRENAPVDRNAPGNPLCLVWYDRCISMLVEILERACETQDVRPAVQAVNSKVLHLLEWRSSTAYDRELGSVVQMCQAIFGAMLNADTSHRNEMWNQIRIIAERLLARSDVGVGALRAWKDVYELGVEQFDMAPPVPDPVCSAIGCVSTEQAGMVCSRCSVCYCTKLCQKSDWPLHKLTCGWGFMENLEP